MLSKRELEDLEAELVEEYELFRQKIAFINNKDDTNASSIKKDAWDTTVGNVIKIINKKYELLNGRR